MKNLLFALAILYATESVAWEQISCILPMNKGKKKNWVVKEYKAVIDPVSIPEGSPQYAALIEAIELMNQNPSQFRYKLGGFDDGDGVGTNNGESEIWMKDLGADSTGVSAYEQSDSEYSPTCTATESDIIINTHYHPTRAPSGINKLGYTNSKSQLFEYGGSYANLRSIIMHELGHSAGLQHESDVLNLMGGDNLLVSNGDVVQPYIGEDSAAGLITLHGKSAAAREEVSVSHWRYGGKTAGGSGGFYNIHLRTRIFDNHNIELPRKCAYNKPDLNGSLINDCPEPIYQVNPGQKIKLELSYENAGKTRTLSTKANYYLSTDNTIDINDTLLKTRSVSLNQDQKPSTLTKDIVIPNSVTKGENYWVGCIVDADDKLKEYIESNNATYINITVN